MEDWKTVLTQLAFGTSNIDTFLPWLCDGCKAILAIAATREGHGVRNTDYSWGPAAESLLEAAATASVPLLLLATAAEPLGDDRYWNLFW